MNNNIEHVKHISNVMKNVSTIVLWVVPICHIIFWTNMKLAKSWGFYHRLPDLNEHQTLTNYMLGAIVSGALVLLVMAGIYQLRKFFKFNSEGKMFTEDSADALHKFSRYFILYTVLSIPVESALSVIMSMSNPVGERLVSVTLQTYDVTLIFISFVLFAISWVVKQSVAIAEENAQFV